MYILASQNKFPEIIYAFFGGRQNIFSTVFGTKFVVICAAKIAKIDNRLTNKDFISKISFDGDFAMAMEIIQDHKLSILATFLT